MRAELREWGQVLARQAMPLPQGLVEFLGKVTNWSLFAEHIHVFSTESPTSCEPPQSWEYWEGWSSNLKKKLTFFPL